MKKNVILFEPAILAKRNLKEYRGYNHSIAFKINKLSSKKNTLNQNQSLNLPMKTFIPIEKIHR